ncbi:hypothetical protein FALCPG4_014461 [Fusarium falciforme]
MRRTSFQPPLLITSTRENTNRLHPVLEVKKGLLCVMAFAAQQRSQSKGSNSIFNETKDQPPEEVRMNDTKAYCVMMRNNLSGKAVPICTESRQNTPIHHEGMSNPTEERIGTSILPRLREKLGHT